MNSKIVPIALLLAMLHGSLSFADTKVEFHRSMPLALADHIILDVAVPNGNVTISYAHAGELSVSATAQAPESEIPGDFFDRGLVVEREGDHVKVKFNSSATPSEEIPRISYTINVPNWIEINSDVGIGNQSISGVMGPVRAVTGKGNLNIQYITNDLEAKTGSGDITVIRVGTAAKAETGSGNINMKDIGPASGAMVKKGTGRVDVDGISGSFTGSTDAGELRVAGAVYGTWNLESASGNIHLGISAESQYEIDVATRTGQLSIENEDIQVSKGDANARACHQKVNGGGKLVRARSTSGTIFIQ
jgi:putative adhesin